MKPHDPACYLNIDFFMASESLNHKLRDFFTFYRGRWARFPCCKKLTIPMQASQQLMHNIDAISMTGFKWAMKSNKWLGFFKIHSLKSLILNIFKVQYLRNVPIPLCCSRGLNKPIQLIWNLQVFFVCLQISVKCEDFLHKYKLSCLTNSMWI